MMRRRTFLADTALAAGAVITARLAPRPAGLHPPPPSDLDEITLEGLQALMRSGAFSSRSVTQHYLDRIDALNLAGPALRAVIRTNPAALDEADRLDAERASRGIRGPLHGVPVLLKDNLDALPFPTTAGSLALAACVPRHDGFVVERLRAAGAVILGKTNLSEWANFRSSHSSSGWSSMGGQCRNPYVLDRSPCGSSSGSAAAVAANLCPVAIGTETDGSIICPSSANMLVGIKPTVGLVSRSGIVPIAHSQDTAGPMARTVTDAAVALAAIAGADPRDPATGTDRGRSPADYSAALRVDGLNGARLGVARKNLFGISRETDHLMEGALDAMRGSGAVLVDPADIPHVGEYDAAELEVLLYEFRWDLPRYLTEVGPDAPVRNLEEVIAFNEANRDRVMPYFGQDLMLTSRTKGPLTQPVYRRARALCVRLSRAEGLDRVLREKRLDAIVAPSGSPAWPIDLVNGDHTTFSSTTPSAVAGYPSITVPVGRVSGLPVGISFMGRRFAEPTLIRLAFAFEQATRARRPPDFLPTIPIDH